MNADTSYTVNLIQKGLTLFDVCADPMAFQPYRIDEADNRRLLCNVFDWMLGKQE